MRTISQLVNLYALANSMEFKLRYKYDGGQTCRPIGATVDSAATPVQLPVATDATIRIEMVSAWSRRVVRPADDIHGSTAWRFAVFDKYGDGMGMLFATRNVDVAESYWKVPWKNSGTKEMFAALGGEPARVFMAELQGYETQESALPTAVFSFPVRVGNRRGDIVAISPLEQFAERDPVALDALNKHASDISNPHAVTAGQVGADPEGTAAKAVGAHNTSETAHADIRSAVTSAQSAAGSAIDAAKAVAGAINAHAASTENPHGVTEEQVAAATEDTDKLFGRLNEPNTWKKHQYVVGGLRVDTTNGEATSEVMSVAKTEYGNVVKFSNCNVSAEGCLIDADAFVTKSILLIDKENGNFYEVSAIGGKLAFNNEPVTLDQVRSATTSAQE